MSYTVIGGYGDTTATLTIEPGVEVRFASGAGFQIGRDDGGNVWGVLDARGNADSLVVFTSGALSKAPGDWTGIIFRTQTIGAQTRMRYCSIEYGGQGGAANIYLDNAVPNQLEHLIISNSAGFGVTATGSAISIQNTDLIQNQLGGLQNLSPGSPINAENNWWGDRSGPSGAGPGSGQSVIGNVDFDPWLLRSAFGDHHAPSATIVEGPAEAAYVAGPEVRFRWTGNDDHTPPDSLLFSYSLDGSTPSPWAYDTTHVFEIEEGLHHFVVQAEDTSGRISDPATRNFGYDLTPPNTVVVSGPPDGGWTNSTSVTFVWSGSDNVSPADSLSYSYKMDSADWSPFSRTRSNASVLGCGIHTFMVKARDLAGQEDPTPVVRTFNVDFAPPETRIDGGPPEGSTIHAASVTFAWTGQDDYTRTADLVYSWKIDGVISDT